MAVVNQKKLEDQVGQINGRLSLIQNAQPITAQQAQALQTAPQTQQTQQAAQQQGYTGLAGVSSQTAQQLQNYQQGYQASGAVTAAQNQLQSVLNQKPQGYESKYSGALDNILQQIQGQQPMQFSFNGSELFKSYADSYTQKGKQAAQNAAGQAAALTGGYGNSYGTQAAGQQFQNHMTSLYDRGLDIYDRELARWNAERQGLMDQFSVLNQADQTGYERYRDLVGDWERERDYATGRADRIGEQEYTRWGNERDYLTQLAQAENADFRTQQQYEENVRQYNERLAEEQRQFDQQMAENKRQWDQQYQYNKMSDERRYYYQQATSIIANGKMPSAAVLKAAGLSEADAKNMIKQAKAAGGGGRSGNSNAAKYYYDEKTNKFYTIDENGYAQKISYNDIPSNGKILDGAIAQSVLSDAKDKQEKDKLPYSTKPKSGK